MASMHTHVTMATTHTPSFHLWQADNYYDAGSCIDGRLTSAWNWCSKLEKKSFYPVFLLTGFLGFDGDFRS